MVPRGVTRPMPGSMAGAPGFSTSHSRTADSPGLMDAGFTSNCTIRVGGPPRPRPAGGAPAAGCCGACAAAVTTAASTPTSIAIDLRTSTSQNDPDDPNDSHAYDLISLPSASFIRLAIIDGAPLFAGAPVAESGSPGLTVLLVQP